MAEMNTISMIVPVYKVPEHFLRACIESCQRQTWENVEILLVDDGSPDQCGAICEEYAAQDPRIRVIHRENGGLCAARNTGFEASTGEWVMFVDGDDWIEPDMCGTMLETALREDVQLVMSGVTKDYGNSSEPYHYYLEEKTYRGEECRWLQQQVLVYNGNIAAAFAKLISRAFLVEQGLLYDEALRQGAEDVEFSIRLFENLTSAAFLNKPFYHYIYNENSISASHDEQNHQRVLNCFRKIRDFIETSGNREALAPWFDNRLLYVIMTTAITGYFSPVNREPYRDKKRKFGRYLEDPMVAGALKTKNLEGLSGAHRIAVFLIRHRMFAALDLMAKMRKRQKDRK